MAITLTPEQQTWLQAHVASGAYASIEEAVRHLVDERIAEEHDDLAWAKPYADEARADIAQGRVITLEEHEKRNDARFDAMKG